MSKPATVRKWWKAKVKRLEARLQRERDSHEATRNAKLVEVNYDKNCPRDYLWCLDTFSIIRNAK